MTSTPAEATATERAWKGFKEFCAKVSIDTSSVQYESDELMRPRFGDDTAIACCVSAMPVGKQMQFFGARVNLAKTLLYAINGGRDEKSGAQVGPSTGALTSDVLDYDEVLAKFDEQMEWLASVYVHALNVIHYMHDRYAYERVEMALHDRDVRRTMACGIAGLSVAADSLATVKYAKVTPVRDETGLATDYVIDGEYPRTATTTSASTRSRYGWSRSSCGRSASTPRTGTPNTPSPS